MARTTLFCASTLFGAMTLAAACDEGRFGTGRRILLVSNNAAIPEITPALDETPGFAGIRDRFDEVVSWNAIIAPLHPSEWKARSVEVPMLGRLLSARLGEPDELVVESIAVPPSRTLAGLLKDLPISVYSDGLMSYGPTRIPLPAEIAGRVTRLLHLDLVPGLVPLLLSEYGVPPEVVSGSAFTHVIGQTGNDVPSVAASEMPAGAFPDAAPAGLSDVAVLPGAASDEMPARIPVAIPSGPAPSEGRPVAEPSSREPSSREPSIEAAPRSEAGREGPRADGPGWEAVILGQYLSSLGILTSAEEAGLHETMLRGLAARGHRHVVFKPHPAAGRRHARELRPLAEELGVELLITPGTIPAEVCFAVHRPRLVVGCFSTALMTARRFFDIPVATVGGDLVLERLSPYENSNRIPATIADAALPRLAADGSIEEPPPVDLSALVRAVGYCMRSSAHPDLRDAAEAYIGESGTARYFKHRRLESLGLLPAPEPEPMTGRRRPEPERTRKPVRGQERDLVPPTTSLPSMAPATEGRPEPGSPSQEPESPPGAERAPGSEPTKTPASRLRRFLSR